MTLEQSPTPAPQDQVIVLFGATGDLAKRKLLPGMFHLAQVGLMPERFRIIGAARLEPGALPHPRPRPPGDRRGGVPLARARGGGGFQPRVDRRGGLEELRGLAPLPRRGGGVGAAGGGDRPRASGAGAGGRAALLPLAAAAG